MRSRRANGTRYQVLQKYKETRNIEKRPSSCWLTNMMAAVKAFVERQMRGEKEQQQWGAPSRGAALGRAQTPRYQTHPYFTVIRASCWHPTPHKHSIQRSIVQDYLIVYWVSNHSWSFIQQGIISESFYSVTNHSRNFHPFRLHWDLFRTTVKVVPFFNHFVNKRLRI